MPADTNPYGDIFGGWLMSQMGLACGSFASRHGARQGDPGRGGRDLTFTGAMAVGDELSVYVDLMRAGPHLADARRPKPSRVGAATATPRRSK